jgi:two-component system OmpR family response regulator
MYTILVVDDSPFIVDVFVTMLERGGYRTVAAYGGEECLEILKTVTPDLILLDIMMPGMNGWEVQRRLKENVIWRQIPVVILTAVGDPTSRFIGSITSKDCIEKPFKLTDLKQRIEKIIKK